LNPRPENIQQHSEALEFFQFLQSPSGFCRKHAFHNDDWGCIRRLSPSMKF
jgi:hypothetical protein